MSCSDDNQQFPQHLKKPIREMHESLEELRDILDKFNRNYAEIKRNANTSLDKAKLDLTVAYAINSLYWIYLSTKGVNPHEHSVKQELSRLKNYMLKVREIEDKSKAAKLDPKTAQRFVRNALFDPKCMSKSSDSVDRPSKKKRKH